MDEPHNQGDEINPLNEETQISPPEVHGNERFLALSENSGNQVIPLNEDTPIALLRDLSRNERALAIPGNSETQIALPADVNQGASAQSEAEKSPAFANYFNLDDWRRDYGDFIEMIAMIRNLRYLTNTLDADSTISARDNKNLTRQHGTTRKSGMTLLPQISLPRFGVSGSVKGLPRRIAKECQNLLKDPKFEVFFHGRENDEDSLYQWKAVIHGPPGTPYEGGKFRVNIQLPKDYPFKPPQIRSDVKIFHPNMKDDDNDAVILCCINQWCSTAFLAGLRSRKVFARSRSRVSETDRVVNFKAVESGVVNFKAVESGVVKFNSVESGVGVENFNSVESESE